MKSNSLSYCLNILCYPPTPGWTKKMNVKLGDKTKVLIYADLLINNREVDLLAVNKGEECWR